MSRQAAASGLMASFDKPQIFISVDLDSWIHCRWASGADHSLWETSRQGFREIYGQDRPGRDFDIAIDDTLALLDEHNLKVTFFVLSEIAGLFPDLLRRIHGQGHEIALHGEHHVDNTRYTPSAFREMIRRSRGTLEDIVGTRVAGYRAANLILSAEQLAILDEEDFDYDSSICPSRTFFGKFSEMSEAPTTPYHPSRENLAVPGDLRIVELPLGVFPWIRLPASTGVMTRVLGSWWARIGMLSMLRKGYASYYFHPYELGPAINPPISSFYVRLFLRNQGRPFARQLSGLLKMLNGRGSFARGCDIVNAIHRNQDIHSRK